VFKYSLISLVHLTLLAGSFIWLVLYREPWHLQLVLTGTSPFTGAALSPDGSLIAGHDTKGYVWLWNRSDGTLHWKSTELIPNIHAPLFNVDGSKLLIREASAQILDTRTKEIIRLKDNDPIRRAQFSLDGKLIAIVSDQFHGVLLDAHSGHVLKDFKDKNIETVMFTKTALLIGGFDKTISAYNWKQDRIECDLIAGKSFGLWFGDLTPDERYFVAGYENEGFRVWNLSSGTIESEKLDANIEGVLWMKFTQNLDHIVSCHLGKAGAAKIWNWRTGNTVHSLSGRTSSQVAISPMRDKILLDENADQAVLWNTLTGTKAFMFPNRLREIAEQNWSSDGNYLILGVPNRPNCIGLWHRRFPECWWGHIYRPELWLSFLLGTLWLIRVIAWIRKQRSSSKIEDSGKIRGRERSY